MVIQYFEVSFKKKLSNHTHNFFVMKVIITMYQEITLNP